MSPIAQRMTVSSTVRKQWLEDVATDVLDPAEKLVIRVFDQLGGRRQHAIQDVYEMFI